MFKPQSSPQRASSSSPLRGAGDAANASPSAAQASAVPSAATQSSAPSASPGNVSRREFIRRTTATAAAGVLTGQAARSARAEGSPNSVLRLGFIGVGYRGQAHLDAALKLRQAGRPLEVAAVCDVFVKHRDKAVERVQRAAGRQPTAVGDFRRILDDSSIDAVVIATPDHWHAAMATAALEAGKAVYCERPMTHTPDEALRLVSTWRRSGQVMQVGVQRTSDGRWRQAREFIASGRIGKVVQAQTEYFRNSGSGQWRSIGLSRDMTPATVDWPMFLGTRWGLCPEMPFDRALFAQWRCYWPFGSGIYSELFVDRVTQMLATLGLRYPRRVTAGGGIFLEYDGRQTPDTATLIADFDEGVQLVAASTLACDHKIEQCIRGHYGTLVFDMARDGFDFLPERPQVTRLRDQRNEHVTAERPKDETLAHWENFLAAVAAGDPGLVNNPPDLAAAAVAICGLGVQSYRQGRVLEWREGRIQNSGDGYARHWEELSAQRAWPRSAPGLPPMADEAYSRQTPPAYQKLAGPWTDGLDPSA